jgi:iron uptake system EfeUOB component EfeO/EfeM
VVVAALLTVGVTIAPGVAPASPEGAAPLSKAAPPSVGLTVTNGRCATGWTPRRAGKVVFRISDRTGHGGSIYLFNPYRGFTVAHTTLRPGATRNLTVSLKTGRYRWSCRLSGVPVRTSAVATVRPRPRLGGPAGPTFQIPITAAQMAPAVASYRAYVTFSLALESSQVTALGTAIAGGQITAARAAWLTAHLTWHRIGGAYDAFGDLGTAIDGTAAGLQAGTSSVQFTGFHKVELDLWQTDDLAAAASDTATLLRDVHALAVTFPDDPIVATELPLRTHEILEDGLRDQLTGDDDYGSGTDMASVEADVDGTRELLTLLAPAFRTRAPDLEAAASTDLTRLDTALEATRSNGQWEAVAAVPLAAREKVDAAIGAALEVLALAPPLIQVVGVNT